MEVGFHSQPGKIPVLDFIFGLKGPQACAPSACAMWGTHIPQPLPTFDVLSRLTTQQTTVSSWVSSLVPRRPAPQGANGSGAATDADNGSADTQDDSGQDTGDSTGEQDDESHDGSLRVTPESRHSYRSARTDYRNMSIPGWVSRLRRAIRRSSPDRLRHPFAI
jgi:hypothetical protein